MGDARARLPELPKLVIAEIGKRMIDDRYSPEYPKESRKALEARYSYYRRCQVFRKNGEQCKAPAETGAHICYAHAREQATAFRRKLQLTILLAEVARRMRQRGKPGFEVADIFMDFNAIQVTLGVMAQAVIDGGIDCKTAGMLAIGLQTAAKVLRMIHRQGREARKGQQIRPQIHAARLSRTQKETSTAEARRQRVSPQPTVNSQNLNTEELGRMRRAEEKTRMRRLTKINSSRRSTNPIVSSADEGRSGKGLTVTDTEDHNDRSGNPAIGIETYQEISLDARTADMVENVCIAEAGIIRVERSNIQRSTGPPEWVRAA